MNRITKLLVANRSENAIRVMRGAAELGIKTVAIYAEEDKLALHHFKADESYQVGAGLGAVKAYLDVEDIVRIARRCGTDAIHPSYEFLSENPDLAERCVEEGIVFVGPSSAIMPALGDKVSARAITEKGGRAGGAGERRAARGRSRDKKDRRHAESNEAFAAQALAVAKELGFPNDKTNPNGGAVALGHPLSVTGAIITTKCLYELKRIGGQHDLVTLCIGGGQGIAAVF